MSKKKSIRKIIRQVWIVAGLLFIGWLVWSYQSHGVGEDVLRSDSAVRVEQTEDYYLFRPVAPFSNILFFYPGAMVDPKAYAPLCRRVADQGIAVYLLRMPWRLAANGYTKPKSLGLFDDTTKTYILAGHSQGAKMAAQFVHENPGLVDRLILIGTTHPRDYSLAGETIAVMKIYGDRDGVADEKSVMNNKDKLPSSTMFVKIPGANHSQFGYYGFQLGDNRAAISREEQQAATLKYMLEFMLMHPAKPAR